MFCTFSSYVFVWTSGRIKSPLKTKENCFFDREKLSGLTLKSDQLEVLHIKKQKLHLRALLPEEQH